MVSFGDLLGSHWIIKDKPPRYLVILIANWIEWNIISKLFHPSIYIYILLTFLLSFCLFTWFPGYVHQTIHLRATTTFCWWTLFCVHNLVGHYVRHENEAATLLFNWWSIIEVSSSWDQIKYGESSKKFKDMVVTEVKCWQSLLNFFKDFHKFCSIGGKENYDHCQHHFINLQPKLGLVDACLAIKKIHMVDWEEHHSMCPGFWISMPTKFIFPSLR